MAWPKPLVFLFISIIIIIMSFTNFGNTKAEDTPVYLWKNCSTNSSTTTANSPFQLNLNTLLTSLSSNPTEFHNTTVTGNPSSNTVYGLFMCRGDVALPLCRQCVLNATQTLLSECSLSKQAVIWYDECTVRYSNRYFFSTFDTRPRLGLLNTANITNQQSFMRLLFRTMNKTADDASNHPIGSKKYATNQATISGFQNLYCLAQCTPDLSPQDCRKCLNGVIGDLPWCCTGKQGGRVLYPSCNVRYELYPFFRVDNASAPSPSSSILPPPTTNPANSRGGSSGISGGTIVAIVVPIIVVVLLFIVAICFLSKRARKKRDSPQDGNTANDITTMESLQFDFGTIEAATNKFSAENKLGEGGFGEVFKGTLPSGQEIAVKRLSKSSGQGGAEFKNEVVVVAKLQHRNLARLLGFCLQGEEKILVYEYVANKSLDYTLFDPEKQGKLDWAKRYKIIVGIARGMQYLHEDSRLRIIHRDLKASNILLDGDMNPKISDFGMARIVGVDQTQGNTSRIVGTYGYMAPEYAMHGEFSVKSDVYSFGVLIMEIISGKKNSSFYDTDGADDLVSYTWKVWKEGAPLESRVQWTTMALRVNSFTLSSSLPKTKLRAGNSWSPNLSFNSQMKIQMRKEDVGGRKIWRRRKMIKKDVLLPYRMERIPFLEEQVRKMRDEGKLARLDVSRILLSEDNRYDFVNEVAAEANSYVESNIDEYGGEKKAIFHVLSNRKNDAGIYRPEAYAEPDPFKPGPHYLKENATQCPQGFL